MEAETTTIQPIIIPRPDHIISRANISSHALKVLYRLRGAGFRACLVGGGVRDLLLGREPKDFDVGTDAHPEDVYKLFRNCRLIGRRFRLAHVRFGRDIIEVATFRARHGDDDDSHGQLSDNGRIIRDNVYGSIEEDALRRDFTINALYYDIDDFSVRDYANGMEDLKAGLIRMIGDPEQRYREDPVRMLRAVRFAAKLGFRIHPATEAPMERLGHLLQDIPAARLFDEVLKLFMGGCAVQTFELLRHYNLFGHLFPAVDRLLRREEEGFPRTLLIRSLANTDQRIAEDKPVTPAFLFAALLWEPLRERAKRLMADGMDEMEAILEAGELVVQQQLKHTALPRRYSLPMREIWSLQPRFEQRTGKRALRLQAHPRFRAAYDFLVLRREAGESLEELADWWTHFQTLDDAEREQAARATGSGAPQRKRRRRPARRRQASTEGGS